MKTVDFGLGLGVVILPIQSCCAPSNTTHIFWRLVFAVVVSPFAAGAAVLIGFLIIGVHKIRKTSPSLIVRAIIGMIAGLIIGAIVSYIDNANSVSRGILPSGMLFAKYGVLVGLMAGLLAKHKSNIE